MSVSNAAVWLGSDSFENASNSDNTSVIAQSTALMHSSMVAESDLNSPLRLNLASFSNASSDKVILRDLNETSLDNFHTLRG